MTTNPGGVVDPADLVGRDRELRRLQKSVMTGGAKLLGDRRIGKTSLLRKLCDQLTEAGHAVIRISAESSDPEEFERDLIAEMRRNHLLGRQVRAWESELGGELKLNVGVAGFTLHGKSSRSGDHESLDLFRACADARERLNAHYRIVFIFDEITVLAEELGRRVPGGPEEMLRMLRAPRQQLTGVSMILAGSVGLHHVLADRSSVNDLDPVPVGPLDEAEATYLTRCLLRGAGIAAANEVDIARVMVKEVCAIPFYLHRLVQDLADREVREPTPADVERAVDIALQEDRWDMGHYIDRVPRYYGGDAATTLSALDEYARSDVPLTITDVLNRVSATPEGSTIDREKALSISDRLREDHYVVRVGAASTFSSSLLRRAWLEMRPAP